jgi:hypothetical protein
MVALPRQRRFVTIKRVTRMALFRTTEPSRYDLTSYPGTELWLAERTEVRSEKVNELLQAHYTEAAARRHVHGLLTMRIAGVCLSTACVPNRSNTWDRIPARRWAPARTTSTLHQRRTGSSAGTGAKTKRAGLRQGFH